MPNQVHLERREITFNREAGGNVCSRKTAWEKAIIILQHLLCADAAGEAPILWPPDAKN